MTTTLLSWLILVVAPGAPTGDAHPPGDPSPTRSLSEDLFRRGVSAYDAHEYAAAIDWFRKAYAEAAEPAILFNIAQAYRGLGDCSKALENVEAYLSSARAGDPLIARAQGKKAELEACVATSGGTSQGRVVPLPSRREAPASRPADAPRLEARGEPLHLRFDSPPLAREKQPFFQGATATTCAVSAGGALAFGLTGIAFAIAANSLAARVDAAMTWTDEVAADDAQRRALGKAALVTAVAAGGAAVIAGTSCWARWRRLHTVTEH